MKRYILLFVCLVVLAVTAGILLTNEPTPTDSVIHVVATSTPTTTPPSTSTEPVDNPNPLNMPLSTATDEKSDITFTYPTTLPYTYVTATEWPPRFINSGTARDCELDAQTMAMSGATSTEHVINGTTYCIETISDGAAGSTYVQYQVTYPQDGQYFSMSFTLRYPQCGNYPDDQISSCQQEQADFPLAILIDSIAQSASLPATNP